MGTSYSVTLPTALPGRKDALKLDIDKRLEEINQVMSTYINDSELSRINQNLNTEWQPISKELYHVLNTALEVSHLTNGAFDISIGQLINIWGFGPGMDLPTVPAAEVLDRAMQRSGYNQISLSADPPAIRQHVAGLYLDLSGIAKGYAVDQIAGLLQMKGLTDYLVEIGGEVRASGHNMRQDLWHIGIVRPEPDTRTIETIIRLDNMSIATSGDYRNYFLHDGTRYSHTIDPATGWPVPYINSSVTVMASETMLADAMATALTVMGPARGLAYARENDISALFIHDDNGTFRTEATPAMLHALGED